MQYPLTLTFKIMAVAPQITVTDANGTSVCYHLKKQPSLFEGVFKIEETEDSPDDILILMAILMMTLLERQRG
jgi:hypothetical protein